MRFPNLKAAWLHFRRAKKEVTIAKNNAKAAAENYKAVKKAANSPVKSLPPRSSNNRGVMRMVRVKNGNTVQNIGMTNNGYNNLKSTHKYNWNKHYWVRKN